MCFLAYNVHIYASTGLIIRIPPEEQHPDLASDDRKDVAQEHFAKLSTEYDEALTLLEAGVLALDSSTNIDVQANFVYIYTYGHIDIYHIYIYILYMYTVHDYVCVIENKSAR